MTATVTAARATSAALVAQVHAASDAIDALGQEDLDSAVLRFRASCEGLASRHAGASASMLASLADLIGSLGLRSCELANDLATPLAPATASTLPLPAPAPGGESVTVAACSPVEAPEADDVRTVPVEAPEAPPLPQLPATPDADSEGGETDCVDLDSTSPEALARAEGAWRQHLKEGDLPALNSEGPDRSRRPRGSKPKRGKR